MAQESCPTLESFHYGGSGGRARKTRVMGPIPTIMDAADLAGFNRRDVL